jgi:hypothetical protein
VKSFAKHRAGRDCPILYPNLKLRGRAVEISNCTHNRVNECNGEILRQPLPGRQLAPDFRPRCDGTLRSFLVQLEPELQRVERRVIESEMVDALPALLGCKAKMSLAVRCRGTQYRDPPLGAICHRHVGDGSARRIKNNTLDSLGRLKFRNDDNFSNRPRRSDEECDISAMAAARCTKLLSGITSLPARTDQIKQAISLNVNYTHDPRQ